MRISIIVAGLPEPLADHEPLVVADCDDDMARSYMRAAIIDLYADVVDGITPNFQAFLADSASVNLDDDAWFLGVVDSDDGPIVTGYTREV